MALAISVVLFKVAAYALHAYVSFKNTKKKAYIPYLILPKAASWYGPFNAIEHSPLNIKNPPETVTACFPPENSHEPTRPERSPSLASVFLVWSSVSAASWSRVEMFHIALAQEQRNARGLLPSAEILFKSVSPPRKRPIFHGCSWAVGGM